MGKEWNSRLEFGVLYLLLFGESGFQKRGGAKMGWQVEPLFSYDGNWKKTKKKKKKRWKSILRDSYKIKHLSFLYYERYYSYQ